MSFDGGQSSVSTPSLISVTPYSVVLGFSVSIRFRPDLILSHKSTINSKPQLEIFADDVKCSHGCTIGQLDQDALFYLRARGIPKKEAEALLTYAFANNVLESVNIPSLKSKIKKIIANKLNVKLGFDL